MWNCQVEDHTKDYAEINPPKWPFIKVLEKGLIKSPTPLDPQKSGLQTKPQKWLHKIFKCPQFGFK